MRFTKLSVSAQVVLFFTILNPVAAFGLLGGIFDAITGLVTGIICTKLHILADLTHFFHYIHKREDDYSLEERNSGFRVPKAGFVITRVDKDRSGYYKVTCNYKADRCDELHRGIGHKVRYLRILGTGYRDIILGGRGYLGIKHFFNWGAQFLVRPVRIRGKCCLPHGLRIAYDFYNDGSELSNLISTELGWSIYYSMQSPENDGAGLQAIEQPDDLIGGILGQISKRDSEQPFGDFSEYTDAEKRDINSLRELLRSTCYNRPQFIQYCWECGCGDGVNPRWW